MLDYQTKQPSKGIHSELLKKLLGETSNINLAIHLFNYGLQWAIRVNS